MSDGNETAFNEGDEVQHKTGGPKMIFVGVDELGQAMCTWMANGRKQRDTFSLVELKPYVKPPQPKIIRS